AFKLQAALGYVRGRPPKDVSTRALAFLKKKPGGDLTFQAGQYLRELFEQDKLPGVSKAEARKGAGKHLFTLGLKPHDLMNAAESDTFPASRKFYGQYSQEDRTYYLVIRESSAGTWKLQRAWKADASGRMVEEFSLK